MGKLIYSMNVSLDGFTATPDGGLEWANVDHELHTWFNDQSRRMVASLYGRRMYELMAGYWPTAADDPDAAPAEREFAAIWNATPKIVFSRSLTEVIPGCRIVAGDVGERLAELRAEIPGDLDVSGPTLAAQFLAQGLVDELWPIVHPVALGAGTRFFPELPGHQRLELLETRTFTSGAVALGYRVVHA